MGFMAMYFSIVNISKLVYMFIIRPRDHRTSGHSGVTFRRFTEHFFVRATELVPWVLIPFIYGSLLWFCQVRRHFSCYL